MAKQKSEISKMQKQLLKSGFTPAQIFQMQAISKRSAKEQFILMLAIPVGILAELYWEKSAKKRVPAFINDCLSLYDSYEKGVVTMEELVEYLVKYGGVDLNELQKNCYRD